MGKRQCITNISDECRPNYLWRAIIFAGLTARGVTCIEEPYKSRNYTEKMLRKCGVEISSSISKKFTNTIKIKGKDYLKNSNFLISFGMAEEYSFEIDFLRFDKNNKLIIFDFSIIHIHYLIEIF